MPSYTLLTADLIDGFAYQDDIEGNSTFTLSTVVESTLLGYYAIRDVVDSFALGSSIKLFYASLTDAQNNAILINRSIKPLSGSDNKKFLITLTFGPKKKKPIGADGAVVSFGASLAGKVTNVDKDGTLITVGTLATFDPTPSGGPYTAVPKTIVEVEKQTPAFTITASKQYDAIPNIYSLVGKLNNASLTIGPQAFDTATLMLTDVRVSSPDNNLTWNCEFTFQYRPDAEDWNQTVVAYDPATGKPYQNITETVAVGATGTAGVVNGAKKYAIYSTADFSSLGLDD